MYKRIDFTNLGGNPLDQQSLELMQSSYRDVFGGLAAMIGDKVIISGVVVTGGNVSDGWITYGGEIIPFIGWPEGAGVVVQEVATYSPTFEDGNQHDVEFVKTATIGSPATFNFSDLSSLTTLINIWLPGDVKEKVCTNDYIAANYDTDGYGLNNEKGWRILSKVYPPSAGAVFVNRNPSDPDFDTVGKYGGEKTHTLQQSELPAFSWEQPVREGPQTGSSTKCIIPDSQTGGTNDTLKIDFPGGDQEHNNMPPYFVILKLIKL